MLAKTPAGDEPLTACWSVKGGSGTTTVAVGLALDAARRHGGALLVDLAGDVPACLGLAEPSGPGCVDWAEAGPDVPSEALERLVLAGPAGVEVLPRGQGPLTGTGARRLLEALAASPRPVVVDAGRLGEVPVEAVAAAASLLVVRPCYLALRQAVAAPARPSGVVLVASPGRRLGVDDVEAVLGVPVVARLPYDPGAGHAVDAGTLGLRFPRALARALAGAGRPGAAT